ncbi:hypothetical protein [Haloferax massiliensis]|uniref:hypothetical protein n=1 Tax=Haloferax massiliensis TaxID=1476858 RepID=UPI000A74D7AB|nr:hypothetical protein [Haloferax massiliensis]
MRRFTTQILLIVIGFVSALLTVAAAPRIGDSPPEQLATVCTLLASGAFLITGSVWFVEREAETERYIQIPAAMLLLLGGGVIVVAIVALQPLQGGITQGLRTILMGIVVLAGGGVAVSGWRWLRGRNIRHPLALHTIVLGLGLSYILYKLVDQAIAPIPTPVLVLIPLGTVVLGLGVLYRFPAQSI